MIRIYKHTVHIYSFLVTQKIKRVVITPGSQAVCIVYIQSMWLIVKNTRQSGSILYIYRHKLYTVEEADLTWVYKYTLIYMFIDLLKNNPGGHLPNKKVHNTTLDPNWKTPISIYYQCFF